MGLHSGLEVMVQKFQVTEILPDLNAELLLVLICFSDLVDVVSSDFFSGKHTEAQITSLDPIYS